MPDKKSSPQKRYSAILVDETERLLGGGPPELAHFDNEVRIESERLRTCILAGACGNREPFLRAAVGDWVNAWREYRQHAKAALRL